MCVVHNHMHLLTNSPPKRNLDSPALLITCQLPASCKNERFPTTTKAPKALIWSTRSAALGL